MSVKGILRRAEIIIPLLTGGVAGYLNFLFSITEEKDYLTYLDRGLIFLISIASYLMLAGLITAITVSILRMFGITTLKKRDALLIYILLSSLAVIFMTVFWFEVPKASAVETGLFKFKGSLKYYPIFCILAPLLVLLPIYHIYFKFAGKRSIGIFLGSLLIVSTLLSLPRKEKVEHPSVTPRPNILLVTIDTLRYDYTGLFEGNNVKTPNLVRFAKKGVTFTNAVSPIPTTGPSHFSILTSTYPVEHGLWINGAPVTGEVETLQSILKRANYRTFSFVSAFVLDARFGFDRDFDIYDDNFYKVKGLSTILPIRFFELVERFWEPDLVVERDARRVTDEVIDFLSEKGRWVSPFFLWVHYFDPHGPYTPPSPYDTLYYKKNPRSVEENTMVSMDKIPSYMRESLAGVKDIEYPISQYKGEITFADHELGRLLDFLEKKGFFENSLVIITSDHGESLTEHDYYFNHGAHLFEPDIRIPLLMRADGRFEPGQKVDEQVELTDIAPTILDFLDLKIPETMTGRSLLPFLEKREKEGWRSEAYSMCLDREENLKVGRSLYRMMAIRTGRTKFIFREKGEPMLFDLITDPSELKNLSSERGEEIAVLGSKAKAILEEGSIEKGYDVTMKKDLLEKLKALNL